MADVPSSFSQGLKASEGAKGIRNPDYFLFRFVLEASLSASSLPVPVLGITWPFKTWNCSFISLVLSLPLITPSRGNVFVSLPH